MKNNTLPRTTKNLSAAPRFRSVNPLRGNEVINTAAGASPVCVDMNKLFGVTGLSFDIAAESYGVVDFKLTASGQLLIQAGEFAVEGSRTRLAIRARGIVGEAALFT
jgi:hypothetical protein